MKIGDTLEVNLAFRGKEEMKRLNQKYRSKNYTPDVLTFGGDLKEILICLPLAEENAQDRGITVKQELGDLITHGIMDLLESKLKCPENKTP